MDIIPTRADALTGEALAQFVEATDLATRDTSFGTDPAAEAFNDAYLELRASGLTLQEIVAWAKAEAVMKCGILSGITYSCVVGADGITETITCGAAVICFTGGRAYIPG